jgi:LacI family transcriptional regulator
MTNTTLKKIAQVLGLSISTISRALKNHPDISEKTKLKVIELANTLDYEPNVNAIHLRSKKNNVFGLIVPAISNFFYDSFVAAVEEESRKNNYSLMILQSGDSAVVELENIKLCRQNRISGLFVCLSSETNNYDAFAKLKEQEIPVIFFDKVPDALNFNKVCVADTLSATLAANALLEKNKKNIIAIFGSEKLLISKKRLAAFKEKFKEHNKVDHITTVHVSNSLEAEKAAEKYLAKKPDAFFCMSDEILTGVMKAIQKKKLNIPQDIGVIGISNGHLPKLYYPEITYVETSGYKLGKLAFSGMMACLGGSTFIQDITTDAILVEGGSL